MPLLSPLRLRRALALALVLAAVPAWGRDGGEASIDIGAVRFVFVKTTRVLYHNEWELRPSAPDTNLYTVRGDGSDLQPITNYANASVRRPDVSFDGRRILFSMNPRPKHGRWHVYECNADGSALRQLTDGACDDIEPFYLPNGRIGFLSTRVGILDEYHRELATLLHTMKPDGSDVRRISFNLSHDIYPRVFRDGRIYAIRWEHRNFRTHRFPLFSIRPDGTEQFSYFGVRAWSRGFREFCELADGRLLLVWPDHRLKVRSPTLFFGEMGTVDVSQGMDAAREPFGPRDGWLYRSPTALPDGRVVAVRARPDSREGGIVVLGRDGRLARVVYDDPAAIELFPAPLVRREPPAIAPSYVRATEKTGVVAGINVFRCELRHDNGSLYQPMGSLRGRIKAVRVIEGLGARGSKPQSCGISRVDVVPLNAEVSLGEVPVHPDGSFAVEVPAGRALVFQALDENGMNLTFHKSWVHVMPGERRVCMGCHEHRDHAPMNQMPLALQQQPLPRAVHRGEPVAYVERVKPILDAKCQGCHDPAGPRSLVGKPYRGHTYRNTVTGPLSRYVARHYARHSYLVWKLYGRPLSEGWGLDTAHTMRERLEFRGAKMPPEGAPQLAPDELRTIVLWVELGACYQAFPTTTPEPDSRPTPPPLLARHPILDDDPPDDGLGDLFAAAPLPARAPGPRAPAASPRILAYPRAQDPAPSHSPETPAVAAPVPAADDYDYKSPTRVCVSRDGTRLFVSNVTAGSISVVDAARRRVVREIPVGEEPAGLALAADGRTLYAALRGEHAVVAVDVVEGRVSGRVTVGHEPYGLALSPDRTLLLVTNVVGNSVSVVASRPLRQLTQVGMSREPRSVAFTPDGRLAVVANALSPQPATDPHVEAVVSVMDVQRGAVIAEVATVDGNALRDIVVSPDGRWAYVAHQIPRANVPTTQIAQGWIQTNGLTVIALRGGPRHVATVPLDTVIRGAANPCGLAIAPDGRTLYVSHTGTHEITAVDLPKLHTLIKTRSAEARRRADPSLTDPRDLARDLGALPRAGVFRRWQAGGLGPMGIALSPKGDRLYVANRFSDSVTVLDTATGRLLDTIRIGPDRPMSLVRRGHFLFNNARPSCFQGWLSCASCHPETGSDGLNWDLLNDGIGNRKNAKMLIGALETPPAMSTGVRPNAETAVAKGFQFIQFRQHTPDEQEAVVAYLRWVRHRPSPLHREADGRLDAAALRGKQLFESPRVGCSSCHPAPLFTTRRIYDVGTRAPEDRRDAFDTPSLRELYRTAPYLHSGAAATVRDVLTTFNPGDRHGITSHLTREQLDDLIAYLLTL